MEYPTPLPPNPQAFGANQLLATAFADCQALEKVPVTTTTPLSTLISARLLGHLLLQLHMTPGLGGANDVAEAIVEAAAKVHPLQELACEYLKYLIGTFNRASPTPAPSVHMQMMHEGNLDHRTSKKHALLRDNFRCVVLGSVDTVSAMAKVTYRTADEYWAHSEAAHIIPDSCNTHIGPGTRKERHMGGVWEVLSCFAQDLTLPPSLRGNNIHRLENIMTLHVDIHENFDSLCLWLKPVDPPVPHQYRTFSHLSDMPGVNRIVTFNHTDALPAPNPKYLALHALACEVAHMSGAAEYLNQIYRDVGDGHLLASDGSSAHLLASALSLVAPVQ